MNGFGRTTQLIAAALLSASLCVGQQNPAPGDAPKTDPRTQPVQPYGPLYQGPGDTAAEAKEQPVPDTRPLSGILGLTLGSLRAMQNTFSASFHFGQGFDSNPGISGPQSDYTGETSFGTNLNLHRAGANQALDVAYSGSSVVYDDSSTVMTSHQLNLAQVMSLGRWTFTLSDAFNYSPQGTLGAGLGFNNLGTGAPINAALLPNQDIYTPLLRQLNNSAGAQIQYGLSPRSSWTAGVVYGNIYYPDGDFGNSHQISVRSGYNRNWTAQDTVSIFYDYGAYRGGNGLDAGVDTHSVQLGYARRVTGRLTWSVTAGPQISNLISSDVHLIASTALKYDRIRTQLSLGYNHAVTEAVFGSTTTDGLDIGITRAVTQRWSVSTNGGLTRNAQLIGDTEFRSGFVGAQVRRSLGERASMFFNYGFQRQITDGACTGAICASLSRQVFGFGFSWTPHTWILR